VRLSGGNVFVVVLECARGRISAIRPLEAEIAEQANV